MPLPMRNSYTNKPWISQLTRVDFTEFNKVYALISDGCDHCHSAGGFVSSELQGDPPMTGLVYFFEPCDSCIGQELCPGCLSPLSLSFDLSAFESVTTLHQSQYYPDTVWADTTFSYEAALGNLPCEGFTCLVCGWQYDPSRYDDQGYDYDIDYDDDPDQQVWDYLDRETE